MLGHQVGLTGQRRLVDLHVDAVDHAAVDHDLVAGVHDQQVTEDDLGRVHLALHPVAYDRRMRACQDRDAVERTLGAHLLEQADDGVGEDDADSDERVEVAAERDQRDAEAEEQDVDEVEDVVAGDLPVRAPAAERCDVTLAGGVARGGLGLREAGRRRAPRRPLRRAAAAPGHGVLDHPFILCEVPASDKSAGCGGGASAPPVQLRLSCRLGILPDMVEPAVTRNDRPSRPSRWVTTAVARGVAFFLGGFTLLNLLGAWRTPGFNENAWWIDVGFLPDVLSGLLLVASGVLLLVWVARPHVGCWRRRLTLAALAILAVAALSNAVTFYRVWSAGDIDPLIPLPFSLVVFAVLAWLAFVIARAGPAPARSSAPIRWLVSAAALLACGLLFPLAQFWFFGHTDYRRSADVAVVMGAQVHQGGRPSVSLVDRVATAIDIYKSGLVKEASDVRRRGRQRRQRGRGHAPHGRRRRRPVEVHVLVDGAGVNTQATVDDTVPRFAANDFRRVLVVSHYYHLPRVKLIYAPRRLRCAHRAGRRRPAPCRRHPYIVAEVAGFWVSTTRAALR